MGETSAKLGGTVNPQGQLTKYFFNYGTSTSYGQKTAEVSAGSGTGNVTASQQLSGLSPGTTYHFQLVAGNSGGTTPGLDQTFTTASTPPPPPPPAPPVLPAPPPLVAGPPDTTITGKPPAKTHDKTPTIKFKASVGRRELPVQRRQQAVQGLPLALHGAVTEARQAQDPGQSRGRWRRRLDPGVGQLQGRRREEEVERERPPSGR